MVADDSESVRDTVKYMLTENNDSKYIVSCVNDGAEACKTAILERPDLMLIDIEMPVMSGIKAIEKIKENTRLRNVPIIVMSSTRQFQEAFEVGANDFLVKPFNEYELHTRIEQNLRMAEREAEIKRQHELLKEQRQEAINQRDIIFQQKTMLTDDLNYAQHIQKAILPRKEILDDLFDGHFIFNLPKNIVSGDFYWAKRKNDQIIFAVGDCTGHGLSGALMTMAGAAFLNEVVSGNGVLRADKILNELRNRIIYLLNQKGELGEASNGMDLALCIYDTKKGILQFSGANNPVYVIRPGQPLEIFKGNRMPIGIYLISDQPFTNYEMPISKGDQIYLFTDGYPDQFGGPMGQKFRYNQFRNLIFNISGLASMDDQLEVVATSMSDWIKGHEQIDDMLVVGVRF